MSVRTETRHGRRALVIDIRYETPDGRRGRFRRYADVQTAAAARAEDRRRQVLLATTGVPFARGEDIVAQANDEASKPRQAPLFADVARDYLTQFAPSHLKYSTRIGYTRVVHTHLVPRFGELRIDAIDASAVRALDGALIASGAKPSTRRNVQAVLRSILCRFAEEAGLLEERPRLPKLPRVGATISSTLAPEEVRKLLDAARGGERVALMLAAFAGLRAGEVRGLRWRDVNVKAGFLVVRQSVCRGHAAPPKSGHERLVPLVAELREALRASRGELDATVTTGLRKPWSDSSLTKAFQRACARADLSGWRLHDLRHFYVTSLFRARLPAPLVQKLAGHEHLATTQRYAHVVDLDLAGVAAAFERTLQGSPT